MTASIQENRDRSLGVTPAGSGYSAEPEPKVSAADAVSIPNADEFFIVDVRREWHWRPYLTLWRPNNAGYAYPLPWAGRYPRAVVDEKGPYYFVRRYACKRALDRFPVPCGVVERLAVNPQPGIVDNDCGPVLLNDATTRAALRRARYAPATAKPGRPESGQ